MERREGVAGDRIARAGARITRIRQVRALTDSALIQAMRTGDSGAFHVFYERFSPALEACARTLRIPTMEWDVCVHDVLTDAAMRFTSGGAAPPKQLVSYLRRMVRNAYAKRRRSALFQAKLAALAESEGDEPVLRALCGESTLHAASNSGDDAAPVTTQALRALGAMLAGSLNRDEQFIMGWVCMRIPYRHIADWIGVEYEATSKRIQRISRRLRELAIARYGDFTPAEQREIDRFLKRASALSSLSPPATRNVARPRQKRSRPVPEAREDGPNESKMRASAADTRVGELDGS